MIEVKIKSISITDVGFVLFLESGIHKKVLPIFIGPVEAQAISMELMGNKPPRPMTHDLIRNILNETRYHLIKVEIIEMKEETFYAKIYLQKKALIQRPEIIAIDSRPSDAIAMAIRFNSPIYATPDLIEEQGVKLNEEEEESKPEEIKDSASSVEGKKKKKYGMPKELNEQLGLYQRMLKEAIKEERFEEASKIRDKIREMTVGRGE